MEFCKNFDDIYDYLDCTDSFISKNYFRKLYDLAKNSNGPILEIGTWKGRSTIALAFGARDSDKGNQVFSVDFYRVGNYTSTPIDKNNPSVNKALAVFLTYVDFFDLRDYVVPIICKSSQADFLIQSITWGLVHIDGSHSHKSVLEDARRVSPRVGYDGKIIFHDSGCIQGEPSWTGVDKAIDDWFLENNQVWEEIEFVKAEFQEGFLEAEKYAERVFRKKIFVG